MRVSEESLRETAQMAGWTKARTDEEIKKLREEQRAEDEAYAKHLSPKGSLHLPKLLDERRLEYRIIDGAFQFQCTYDRILVFQISQFVDDRFGDTMIHMPEQTKEREQREAPRGILIGAGLSAMDSLHSNGIGLGHIVTFARDAVWRFRIGVVRGKSEYALILRAGDLLGSEDLAQELRGGGCRITRDGNQHKLVTGEGEELKPYNPKMAEEF